MKTMKQFTAFILLLAVISLIVTFSGCKKNEENNVRTCNLTTITDTLPMGMNVTYIAKRTGDGSFASITFVSDTGNITIKNPVLPWSVTIPFGGHSIVGIKGTGTVTNGSIQVSFNAKAGSDSIYSMDQCSQSVAK